MPRPSRLHHVESRNQIHRGVARRAFLRDGCDPGIRRCERRRGQFVAGRSSVLRWGVIRDTGTLWRRCAGFPGGRDRPGAADATHRVPAELCVQSVVLCRRVPTAAAPAGLCGEAPTRRGPPPEVAKAASRSSKTVACRVSPVWSRGVLRHVLGICLARASKKTVWQIKSGAALYEVCSLVCLFDGAVPPEAFNTHKVSVTSLSHV